MTTRTTRNGTIAAPIDTRERPSVAFVQGGGPEPSDARSELDQLAYMVSHELKAPLRGIANLSQWIEDDLGDTMTDQARVHMEKLRARVHRMEALIDAILQYSRVGRTRTPPEHVDVGRLVKEVVELLAPPPHVALVVAPDLPSFTTEKVLLEQVFVNLIGNAVKHGRRDRARIFVGSRDRGHYWELFVEDDGPGIPADQHERIWGVFQTLRSRDDVESTGVGLAIVRKIVSSKGGRAWVESEVGRGATFRFTWPKSTELGPVSLR